MRYRTNCLSASALKLALLAALPLFANSQAIGQSERIDVWLKLRDGSFLSATTEDESIEWVTVKTDGSTQTQDFRLSEIRHLELTVSPASQQISHVRRLIDNLGAEDFHKRKAAERELLQTGGPFVKLLEGALGTANPESRYRIRRILSDLDAEEAGSFNLDHLTTESKSEEGDVRDWTLDLRRGSTTFKLDREHLQSVYFYNPLQDAIAHAAVEPEPVSVNFPGPKKFYQPDQVHIGFEKDAEGQPINKNEVIEDRFIDWGCRLRSVPAAWQVIVPAFEFGASKTRENAAANYYKDPVTSQQFRYVGEIEVSFCQPGWTTHAAGAKQFACYSEIVIPRQTIIEAYNAAGHRIAMLEASQDRSSFFGFSSNQPIVRFRVVANKYLNLEQVSGEDLNEDFAVDDICYADLVALRDYNHANQYQVVLENGERIGGEQLQIDRQMVHLVSRNFGEAGLDFALDEIASILAPRVPRRSEDENSDSQSTQTTSEDPPTPLPEKAASETASFVMMSDGSVVKADIDESVTLVLGENKSEPMPYSDFVGMWTGQRVLYPEAGDLENGHQAVVVYPACRFAVSAFDATEGVFSVPPDALTYLQQNPDISLGAPEPQVAWEQEGLEFPFDELPCIWFRQPSAVDSDQGLLRLRDGQQFVLGGSSGFELTAIGTNSLTLRRGERTWSIPLADIAVYRR